MASVGVKGPRGQSLVEFAIALPLLLIILVGIVDVGRVLYYAIALETGAHEGAAFAAAFSSPDPAAVKQRVCDATGFAEPGSACDGLEATLAETGDPHVEVTYDVRLLFGQLLGPLAGDGVLHVRASATYPRLAP
jgi:Flp pilus assembly protein TadG